VLTRSQDLTGNVARGIDARIPRPSRREHGKIMGLRSVAAQYMDAFNVSS